MSVKTIWSHVDCSSMWQRKPITVPLYNSRLTCTYIAERLPSRAFIFVFYFKMWFSCYWKPGDTFSLTPVTAGAFFTRCNLRWIPRLRSRRLLPLVASNFENTNWASLNCECVCMCGKKIKCTTQLIQADAKVTLSTSAVPQTGWYRFQRDLLFWRERHRELRASSVLPAFIQMLTGGIFEGAPFSSWTSAWSVTLHISLLVASDLLPVRPFWQCHFFLSFFWFVFCFFLHEGCILSFKKKKKKDPLVFLCFHFVFQRCITMNAHQLTGKGLYELTVV